MQEYLIRLREELWQQLGAAARQRGMTVDKFIEEILNKYFVPVHTIDHEAMAVGYQEMGEINLELSK